MKKYIVSIVSFIMALGCSLSYNVIGSEVLADGTLKEPFFLIPIGFVFLFIGIISLIINLVINKKISNK